MKNKLDYFDVTALLCKIMQWDKLIRSDYLELSKRIQDESFKVERYKIKQDVFYALIACKEYGEKLKTYLEDKKYLFSF